jgi:hypothetical protein
MVGASLSSPSVGSRRTQVTRPGTPAAGPFQVIRAGSQLTQIRERPDNCVNVLRKYYENGTQFILEPSHNPQFPTPSTTSPPKSPIPLPPPHKLKVIGRLLRATVRLRPPYPAAI